MGPPSFERALLAIELVRQRLLRVTGALEEHCVPNAVVGDFAVEEWVRQVDEDGVRNSVEVQILLNRNDLPQAARALAKSGFEAAEVNGETVFLPPSDPRVKRGVRIVFANEQSPRYGHPASPDITQSHITKNGLRVIDLAPLLRMKLSGYRLVDKVHLADMLDLGLITDEHDVAMPPELRARLDEFRANPE